MGGHTLVFVSNADKLSLEPIYWFYSFLCEKQFALYSNALLSIDIRFLFMKINFSFILIKS